MRRRDALATAGTLALAGCLGLESPDRDGGNESDRDNESDLEMDGEEGTDEIGGDDHENELERNQSWAVDFGAEHGGHLADETIYTLGNMGDDNSHDYNIVSVDAVTGTVNWVCETIGDPHGIYAESGDNLVYVACRGTPARLYALERETGTIEATAELEDTRGTPARLDETIVVGTSVPSEENHLMGLDPQTLEELWRLSDQHARFGGAVAVDGVAVASFGGLSGYRPRDGDALWETEIYIPSPRFGPFTDDGTRLFTVDQERRQIARVDPQTGGRTWTIEFETRTGSIPGVAVPLFDGDRAVIGVERHVIAFDPVSGQRQWAVELPSDVASPIAATEDAYWVLDKPPSNEDQGTLYGFDTDDGSLRYRATETVVNDGRRLFSAENRLAVFDRERLRGYEVENVA